MRLSDRHDFLFTLRPVKGVTVHAFDANLTDSTGHSRIDVEVRANGKVVFPRGAAWCAVAADYTEAQMAFTDKYGEEIDYVREMRYCDENGNVKKGGR
jgi:hypothetical protein